MSTTEIDRHTIGMRTSVVGIVLNTILCAAKAAIGLIAGSVSIVADAVNNLSDAASNIISLLGFKLAAKPADADHPYGHGRYEYLASLTVAALILIVGFELARGSVDKILNPEPLQFSVALVAVLTLSIAVKIWMCLYNHKMGKLIDSNTLEAASIDSRNDVITTAVVLLTAVIGNYTGLDLDGIMGLAVAAFILWSGVGLIRDTIDPLLGRPADPELVKRIADKCLTYEGVLGIHDLLVHDYGPGRIFASIHIEVAAEVSILESHELADDIEEDFLKNDHLELVVHLDPIVTTDPHVAELREWVSNDVRKIDERLTIHDLRVVPGEGHTNVLFDCVETYDIPIPEDELVATISQRVAEAFPKHRCVIKVDHI